MHNITRIICNGSCDSCHVYGFFTQTPDGGDYSTCGVCGDNCSTDYSSKFGTNGALINMNLPKEELYKILGETPDDVSFDEDNKQLLNYCSTCRIMPFIGCVHSMGGCTDNVYNTHFISEWIDKKTGEKHIGMPQFDNDQEWFHRVNDVEIVKMCCPNKNSVCTKASYPITTHPQYYYGCFADKS